jgi:hypothetical protein
MDITIVYMPDAQIQDYHPLAEALTETGLVIDLLFLNSSISQIVLDSSHSVRIPEAQSGINIRIIDWDDQTGSQYLGHYYAAVYSRAPSVLVIGSGFQPDSNTVISMLQIHNEGYDVVIASRHHKLSKLNYPLNRWLLSKFYNKIASFLLQTHTTDATSGLKLYSKEALIKSLGNSRTKGLTFQLELIRRAQRQGARITEVPVDIDYQNSPYVVRSSDIVKTAIETFKLWWSVRS